ncbi:hypothetical protein SVA_1408 [Sulfurifustis variabilis]|uniref:Uncharacterized protein n=1 Tax=Sulfurifustis variabilis TaxID=1675686 RepID=A0A1B4V342_9GAMM|nr:hypothetical protein [Sulfurifustis variabilis]BAU47973.1 hypothetical protein SVA_1408 [Sulfurifustis variabilis]
MIKFLHHALHDWLDTRTKKALAVTLAYAVAWVSIYGVLPAPDSLAVALAGSREAAQHVGEVILEVLFWVTVSVVLLVALAPSRLRPPTARR